MHGLVGVRARERQGVAANDGDGEAALGSSRRSAAQALTTVEEDDGYQGRALEPGTPRERTV